MLAYAARNPRPAAHSRSPRALALIVAGHAALIAAVMAARMEMIPVVPSDPPIVVNVPTDEPPPPEPEIQPQTEPQLPQTRFIQPVEPIVPVEPFVPTIPVREGPVAVQLPIGDGDPVVLDPPRREPVKVGPRLATNDSALRPPYPLSKIREQEEATLSLKLTIDARGRVIAVDPVGTVDPVFLEAARRHILKAWRYKPATEDGVATPATTVINLSFRLEQG